MAAILSGNYEGAAILIAAGARPGLGQIYTARTKRPLNGFTVYRSYKQVQGLECRQYMVHCPQLLSSFGPDGYILQV